MPTCKEYRQLVIVVVLCGALCATRAQEAQSQARTGALADGVSSAVGIAVGVPVNPVLPVIGVGFKLATFRRAESLPDTERPRAYALAAAGWQGSAAANACAVASVLTGGSFLPACFVIGAAWGWNTWKASEGERMEAERCAQRRISTHRPRLRCPVMRHRVMRAAAPARSLVVAQDLVAP